MDRQIYSNRRLELLRLHVRKRRTLDDVPTFIFSCGGDPTYHPARTRLKDYITSSKNPCFRNVYCVNAENMADMPEFSKKNLLIQEAMIIDASDCVILFAESVGSWCELGAFSALPTVYPILTVAYDKTHGKDKSFLMKGPIAMVRQHETELAKAIGVDLDCPTATPEFTRFLASIKSAARGSTRKQINTSYKEINLGGYVHELLDIVNYFAPILSDDVEVLYRSLKGFPRKNRLNIVSPTITESIKDSKAISRDIDTEQVLAFMKSSQMIAASKDADGREWLNPIIRPEHSFMFRDVYKRTFQNAQASILLDKRRKGILGATDVYHRFDVK